MLNVTIACLLLKSGMKSIQDVNIMSHTQKLCVTNVFLPMWLSKDSNTDMLIMFSSWILIKFKVLLSIGYKKNTLLNKELAFCMVTTLKILIIRVVSESLFKQFMNLIKLELTAISQSKIHLQSWTELISSPMAFHLKELDGFTLKLIMIQWWTKRNLKWLQKCKRNTELCIHLVIKFQTLLLSFLELMKKILVMLSQKFIWSVIKVKLFKDTIFLLTLTIENLLKLKSLKGTIFFISAPNKLILLSSLEEKMQQSSKQNFYLSKLLTVHQSQISLLLLKNLISLQLTEINQQEKIWNNISKLTNSSQLT